MTWPRFPHFIPMATVQQFQNFFLSYSPFVSKKIQDLSQTDHAVQREGVRALQNLAQRLFPSPPFTQFRAALEAGGKGVDLVRRAVSSVFVPVQETEERLEAQLITALNREEGFQTVSQSATGIVRKAAPAEFLQLSNFLEQNAHFSEQIKEKGWNALKKEWVGERRKEGEEFDSFRRGLVRHVEACIQATVEKMGYAGARFLEVGTQGWNSDIDVSFDVPEGMKEEIATYACELFYMVVYDTLGEHPGFALDTECYVGNASDILEAEEVMREGGYSEGFSRIEADAFNLQMLHQLKGPDTEGWRQYKQELLENMPDPNLHGAIESSFAAVEEYYLKVEVEVQSLEGAFDSYQRSARLEFRRKIYQEIAPSLDKLKTAISSSSDLAEKARLQGLLSSLILMRTTFFDEGYLSKGSFLKVVAKLGGQAFQNITVKEFQEKLVARYRRVSDLQAQKVLRQQVVEELTQEELVIGFSIPKGFQSKLPSMQDSLSTSMENEAMYEGHFQEKLAGKTEDSDFQKAFVTASKYALRTLEASLDLVRGQKRKLGADGRGLEGKIAHLQKVAEHCEQVKRDKALNLAAGVQLLEEALLPRKESARVLEAIEQLLQGEAKGIKGKKNVLKKLRSSSSGGGFEEMKGDHQVLEETSTANKLRREVIKELKQQITSSLLGEFKEHLSSEGKTDAGTLLSLLLSNKLKEKTNTFLSKYRDIFTSEKELKSFFVPLLQREAMPGIVELFNSSSFRDESALPQDRFLVVISKLVSLGFKASEEELVGEGNAAKDRLATVENKEAEAIALALCGFNKAEYPQIQGVLDKAAAITLGKISFEIGDRRVDLTTKFGIEAYNQEMREVTFQAAALAYKAGVVSPPAKELASFNGENYSLPSLLDKALNKELASWVDSQLT